MNPACCQATCRIFFPDPASKITTTQPAAILQPIIRHFEPESEWIPATKLFSPHSSPLLLPALDNLIIQTNSTISLSLPHLSPQESKTYQDFIHSQTLPKSPLFKPSFSFLNSKPHHYKHTKNFHHHQHTVLEELKQSPLLQTISHPNNITSSSNRILLPMHLFNSKILKPLNLEASNSNPLLALLNFIPTTTFDPLKNSPQYIHNKFSSPNCNINFFIILAHLEKLRDFLQFITLIAGFYRANISTSNSIPNLQPASPIIISKHPAIQAAFKLSSLQYWSFRNYSFLLFQWIPALLSLDLTAFLGYSTLLISFYYILISFLLYEFYLLTAGCNDLKINPSSASLLHPMEYEGYDLGIPSKGTSKLTWIKIKNLRKTTPYFITITLVLLSLYLPVTRVCMEVLVWGNNLWPIDNYYIKNQDQNLNLAEQLPVEVRGSLIDPLEFCYRTTITNHAFEARGLLLFLSILILLALGAWFPFRFYRALRSASFTRNPPDEQPGNSQPLPHMSPSSHSPAGLSERFSYFFHGKSVVFLFFFFSSGTLHHQASKQDDKWASVRTIMNRFSIKFIIIFLTTIPVKDNCIFIQKWQTSRYLIDLMRYMFLSLAFLLVWLFQAFWKPYRFQSLNLINDLNIKFCLFLRSASLPLDGFFFPSPGSSWALAAMYILNIHYLVIHFKRTKRLLSSFNKTLQIDEALFSKDCDFGKEVVRRVWHESLCTFLRTTCRLLGMPEYRMAEGKKLQWREEVSSGAPYLLNFEHTHGERLVENFRLLERLGTQRYREASRRVLLAGDGSDESQEALTQRMIQSDYTGPDCFWKPPDRADHRKGVTTFFGRADVVPFPFMVVFKYDQDPTPVCISRVTELRAFVAQNQHPQVRMRRKVRLLLRALENQEVFAPISVPWEEALQATKSRRPRWLKRADSSLVSFRSGILKIHRNCQNEWQGYNFNSGFLVSIHYKDGQSTKSNGSTVSRLQYTRLHGSLGLRDDFTVTPTLAKLFQDNHPIIRTTIGRVEQALASHRSHFWGQATSKQNTMSFSFLEVFFQDQGVSSDQFSKKLTSHLLLNETNQQLRLLPHLCRASLAVMEERIHKINQNKLNQWWFVIFDDIYRRNYSILNRLSNRPEDFSPHYRDSICYKPMTRNLLERYLKERKVFEGESEVYTEEDWEASGEARSRKEGVFHSGLLNRIYLHLDLFMFEEEDRAAEEGERQGRRSGCGGEEDWLPRSKLYQGVYGADEASNDGEANGGMWRRLKRGLRSRLLLEEPFGEAEEETLDVDDGESQQAAHQLIKLGPWRNFIKRLSTCTTLPDPSLDPNRAAHQDVASSHSNLKGTHHSTARPPSSDGPPESTCYSGSQYSAQCLSDFDIADHSPFLSQDLSADSVYKVHFYYYCLGYMVEKDYKKKGLHVGKEKRHMEEMRL
ncbi:hypothetical protein VP01_228g3 [Puccinia sorghi]|uniref:Uncharacterized protein n=1 Tax=Puccinia sorghi TaxID=27349 RepID=A0A0L6V9W6_9BASI|nr:hypothetical protein VP01_228g3 [Puccinia sorghi]